MNRIWHSQIIYHHTAPGKPCPDGICGAAVAKMALERNMNPEVWGINLIGCAYSEKPPELSEEYGKQIYIVDFSFGREVIDSWIKRGFKIILLDHHASPSRYLRLPALEGTFTIVGDSAWGIFNIDLKQSGAMLAWKYFFPNEYPPAIVRYTQDRDLWRWQLPHSRAINNAIYRAGCTLENYTRWLGMSDEEFLCEMLPAGEFLEEKDSDSDRVASVAKRYQIDRIGGYEVPVVWIEQEDIHLRSQIAEYLYQNLERFPFAAVAWHGEIEGEQRDFYSLRAKSGGFNTEAIAWSFGGGGHIPASGFNVPMGADVSQLPNRELPPYNSPYAIVKMPDFRL